MDFSDAQGCTSRFLPRATPVEAEALGVALAPRAAGARARVLPLV